MGAVFSISDEESVTIFAHLPTPRGTLITRTAASSKDCTSSVYFFGMRWAQPTDHVRGPYSGIIINVQELSCSQQHLVPFQGLNRDDLSYIQRKIQDEDARQEPPTFQRTTLPPRPTAARRTLVTRRSNHSRIVSSGRADLSPVEDDTDRDHHPFTAVRSIEKDRAPTYYYWWGDQGGKYHLQGWMLGVTTIKGYLRTVWEPFP